MSEAVEDSADRSARVDKHRPTGGKDKPRLVVLRIRFDSCNPRATSSRTNVGVNVRLANSDLQVRSAINYSRRVRKCS